MRTRALAAVVALLCAAAPVDAQQTVTLEFDAGQVTLVAQNAQVRAVLAEWARLGGATIVNGEGVIGPPVTLELHGVSERQALDVLLRSVAGYMLAPRRAGSDGVSAFDRIVILPTSTAPRNPPPAPAVAQRPVMPRPAIVMPPQEEYPFDGAGLPVAPGADAEQPQVAPMPFVRPGMPRVGGGANVPQPIVVMPQPGSDEPQVVTFDGTEPSADDPQSGGVAPTPSNPFGVPFGSSTTPGVIVIAPESEPADGIQ